MIVAVVATASCVSATLETVRASLAELPQCRCEVLDLDGLYSAQGAEHVRTPEELGLRLDQIRLTHDDSIVANSLTAIWAAHLLDEGEPVLAITPGVLLQSAPEWDLNPLTTVAVVRSADPTNRGNPEASVLATEMFMLGADALAHRAVLQSLVNDWRSAGRWLDLFAPLVPHRIIVDDAVLISRANSGPETTLELADGRLVRDGRGVVALDLTGLDPERPWLFDGRPGGSSGPLLSRNPALASAVLDVATRAQPVRSPVPIEADSDLVRNIARDAQAAGENLKAAFSDREGWLLELVPRDDRGAVARYLAGIHRGRADLAQGFPNVPGGDSARLAQWALDHGVHESGYDPILLDRAAELTIAAHSGPELRERRRPRGVNLIGYLSGALGIGSSARLMDAALEAAGVPTSTFAVSVDLQSRATAPFRRSGGARFDTSLLAVNADQAKIVADSLPDVVAGTYRIGMWYWEVESFPPSRDSAFASVDEVWVATDFLRAAIAERATVPVRTVMPPLPQRSEAAPPEVPTRLGIPRDRPWFFFAFDYLSTVERKNPLGLIEAFARAFPQEDEDGPVLVIKTLNADRRAGDAERVRLAATSRRDVLVIDDYLEPQELTALMARCTAYVSLHRAEGLGLTVAEAMAWGRPVVVSAYSGTMQFTNSENAYLVPCAKTTIPVGAEPYPAGTLWGDPDLDQAADILRLIVSDPEAASEVGRQAAEDIRVLHSAEAAAGPLREQLAAARRRQRTLRAKARIFWFRPLLRRLGFPRDR